jgi:signal transduction histidine kinase
MKTAACDPSRASRSFNTPDDRASLAEAFDRFNENSGRLEASFAALNREVERLKGDLERANASLRTKVAELDRLSRLLADILDCATDCVFFVEKPGSIRFANRAAADLLGLPEGPAGRSAAALLEPFPCIARALEDVFANWGKIGPRDERLRLPGSGSIPVTVTVRPFTGDGRAAPEGAVVTVRDLSAARALERAAKRNSRLAALGRMAAQLSHEFRNVVGGLEGMAQLLVKDVAGSPAASATATNLRNGLRELNDMVSRLLEFSRPARAQLSAVPLERVLSRSVALEREGASHNGFHVEVRVQPGAGMVRADEIALRQVLVNLLRNAREAMPEGGAASISAALQKDGRVAVTVDDGGPGIPEGLWETVFDPFFTTKADGTGLGLANCSKLMEAQDGAIEACRSPVGGTRFVLKMSAARN